MIIFGFGPENVGLIFPMIASHFSKRYNDQQNHWVQWGLANSFRHTHIPSCYLWWFNGGLMVVKPTKMVI